LSIQSVDENRRSTPHGNTVQGISAGGTAVTIFGTNFTGASAVQFGAVNATSYTVVSPTHITAVSPAGSPGSVDITVTTRGGTSPHIGADTFLFV